MEKRRITDSPTPADNEAEDAPTSNHRKRVRFSDIGPSSSTTGLTPAIGRSSLSSRRASTPPPTSRRVTDLPTPPSTPYSHTIQVYYPATRQTLTPRTRRSLRRHRLSEEQNALIAEEKAASKTIRRLQDQIRDLTWQLGTQTQNQIAAGAEQQRVEDLQNELDTLKQEMSRVEQTSRAWSPATTADRSNLGGENDDTELFEDEEQYISPFQFHDEEPATPSSISRLDFSKHTYADMSCQASLPDPSRMVEIEAFEIEIERLTRETGDVRAVLAKLHGDLTQLGFAPTESDDELATSLRKAVRSARLELEDLLPGETVCGTENGKSLLEALLTHVRNLLDKQAESSKTISCHQQTEAALRSNFKDALVKLDEYKDHLATIEAHRTELLASIADLTETIQSRSDELAALEVTLQSKDQNITELKELNQQQTTSNSRLQAALDTYRAEHKSYEEMIMQLEATIKEMQSQSDEATAKRNGVEEELASLRSAIEEKAFDLVALIKPGLKENVTIRPQRKSGAATAGRDSDVLETGAPVQPELDDVSPLEGERSGKRNGSMRDSGVEMVEREAIAE